MANLDVPGYVITILWIALALSIIANIILVRKRRLRAALKKDNKRPKTTEKIEN